TGEDGSKPVSPLHFLRNSLCSELLPACLRKTSSPAGAGAVPRKKKPAVAGQALKAAGVTSDHRAGTRAAQDNDAEEPERKQPRRLRIGLGEEISERGKPGVVRQCHRYRCREFHEASLPWMRPR